MVGTADIDPIADPIPTVSKDVFERQGYLSLERIASPADVALIRTILVDLFARRSGFAEGAFFDFCGTGDEDGNFVLPQLLDPRSFAPRLMQTEFFRNATLVACRLLGPEARLASDHALLKPAFFGGVTPWHQDEAFRRVGPERSEISIWMPLQAVDQENGCLGFIPGSHAGAILPHRSVNGNARIHGLECYAGFDEGGAVFCPLPAGGCTIHTSRTLHGAGANRSPAVRLAYVMVFHGPPTSAPIVRERPWLSGKMTPHMDRRSNWLLHGGIFVHGLRRFRQAKHIGYHELAIRLACKLWKLATARPWNRQGTSR